MAGHFLIFSLLLERYPPVPVGRSRRERREAQAQRALEARDPEAFGALAAKSPELAAQQLARTLAAVPAGTPSPLDSVAAALCERLRHAGDARAAGKLAGALVHRSLRFRLEQALAAFALGDDAEAERAAAADPAVLAVMGPLLRAARVAAGTTGREAPPANATSQPDDGSTPETASAEIGASAVTKKRGRPPKALADRRSDALRALHGVAEAAAAASLGQTRAGRDALRAVPASHAAALLAKEMSAALDLPGPRIMQATNKLAGSPAITEHPELAKAVARAIARKDVSLAFGFGKHVGLSIDALASIGVRRAPAAGGEGASAAQAALQLAGTRGADAFAVEHRAAACLYEGFGALSTDTKRAAQAFDRAIGLGADMLEALRGKLLLAMSKPVEMCPDCGRSHGAAGHGDTTTRDAAAAADRFARAARHVVGAEPFAAAASILAADAWGAGGDMKAALASIDAGRTAAKGSATVRAQLDLLEARALQEEKPERAAELLDGLLKDDPTHLRAWHARIDLAGARDGERGAGDFLIRAAAATGDRELASMARTLRIRRGEIAAFETLAPGAATAGALAAEALAFLTARKAIVDLPPPAEACRAALPPPARLAFDAALLAFGAEADDEDAVRRLLAKVVGAWWDAPPMLSKLAAITWTVGLSERLALTAQHLGASRAAQTTGPALGAIFDAAIAAEDRQVAQDMLRLGAMHWKRTEVQSRRRALEHLPAAPRHDDPFGGGAPSRRRAPRPGGAPTPEEASAEFDKALAPEIRPDTIWFGPEDDLDDLDDDLDGEGEPWDDPPPGKRAGANAMAAQLGTVASLLTSMGLTPEALTRLPNGQQVALAKLLSKVAVQGLPPGGLAQLRRDIEKVLQRK